VPASVPYRRPGIEHADVKVGASVRGFTSRNAAELAHWTRGRGMCIVPHSRCGRRISSADGTVALHYYTLPSPFAIARIWSIHAHSTGSTSGDMDVTIGSGPTRTYTAPTVTSPANPPIVYVEELAAKVVTATDATVTLVANTTDTIQIDSVSCYELPRPALTEDATEYGVDLESFFPQSSIHDTANESAHALAELVDDLNPRRVYINQYHTDWSTSSGSYTDVYTLPLPALAPYTGSATKSVTWAVWASMSGAGNSGTFRLTAASGATDTITLTADASTWAIYGTSTITINAEDVTKVDGLPASTWETLQLAAKVDSGGGSIRVAGLYAFDG